MSMPRHKTAVASRLADRLFLGGCTAIYLMLIATVLAALGLYGR